jgi:hypothetical protein
MAYLHKVSRLRMVELYLHSHICLHGVVFNNIIKFRDSFTMPLLQQPSHLTGPNDEICNVKPGGACGYHCSLRSYQGRVNCTILALTWRVRDETRTSYESVIFWGMTPCSLVESYRWYRTTYYLHLQFRRVTLKTDAVRYSETSSVVLYPDRHLNRVPPEQECEMT